MTSPDHSPWSSRVVIYVCLLAVFAGVFSRAWWMIWRAKPSERAWGLVASSLCIFIAFLQGILAHRLEANSIFVGLSVVGFVAFGSRLKPRLAANNEEKLAIAGDFTSGHVNRVAQGVTFGLSFGAYLWWQGWLAAQHITALNSALFRFVLTLVVLLTITSIHEIGHAIVGMICGMKLRAFFIGPFQWHVRDAKWGFEFKPKGLILADGVTALIPGNGKLSPRQYLTMMAAGSLANVLTGSLALFLILGSGVALPAPVTGFVALFGAWSLGLAAANLIPFRTPQGYSDGAVVLQLLAGGAFAEFHLSVARIGSSLVSSLRPRDYDIGSIRSAARGIAHGRQALLMWLYAFSHSIDSGKTEEADEVLANAELVCLQSASNIPAELHTTFVFGNALVRRDPKATRFWWNRMQAKNPTRFNADYWRAESALHWIEGNLDEARTAWEKSNALAEQLPQVGAYDFSRHCCALLRHELDQAAAA
jgi:Peptidase family M50